MERPNERAALDKLIGDWSVDVQVKMPDGNVLNGTGRVRGESICMGYGIHTHLRMDITDFGVYEEHDLWGYDADTQEVHFLTITNSGAVHDHVGRWKDENTLEFIWKGLADGKDTVEQVRFQWVSPNDLRVHEEDTIEGEPGPIFDFTVRKQ